MPTPPPLPYTLALPDRAEGCTACGGRMLDGREDYAVNKCWAAADSRHVYPDGRKALPYLGDDYRAVAAVITDALASSDPATAVLGEEQIDEAASAAVGSDWFTQVRAHFAILALHEGPDPDVTGHPAATDREALGRVIAAGIARHDALTAVVGAEQIETAAAAVLASAWFDDVRARTAADAVAARLAFDAQIAAETPPGQDPPTLAAFTVECLYSCGVPVRNLGFGWFHAADLAGMPRHPAKPRRAAA